jgi:hypothetical protein
MRFSALIFIPAALVTMIIIGLVGFNVLQPARPLLENSSFSHTRFTPNADGQDDLTEIRYTLNRAANVTIALTNESTGQVFKFRDNERRSPENYAVLFSGVVDGYADLETGGEIERQLIPNGDYTWSITAVADDGETVSQTGAITVADADSALPAISGFSISPDLFTPNRDGIDDRVNINVFLEKDATLLVYLVAEDGTRYNVPERFEGREQGEAGAHVFNWDGGVDDNVPPPPDGEYTVIATAQDAVGQRVRREGRVNIASGGLPLAEIVAQSTGTTISWATMPYDDAYFMDETTQGRAVDMLTDVESTMAMIDMPLGDMLVFRLTVRNYGTTPLRTVGPFPGTVYQYDQMWGAIDPNEPEVGAWRIGIECERVPTQFPWRWAIGAPDQLTKIERDGETFYYLEPGAQAVVWGAIRMTELIESANPRDCYAALIQEGVNVFQNRTGVIDVRLLPTD